MVDNALHAGHYILEEFSIQSFDKKKKIDISKLIHVFSIIESTNKGSVRGFATIYDTFDLIKDFPLRGEEIITITYVDFFQKRHTDKMFLYSITDVQRPGSLNNVMQYNIHFVSVGKLYTEAYTIRKAYRLSNNGSSISDHVESVYNDYYKSTGKRMYIEQTTGDVSIIVPNYTPEETMHFFARRAYSIDSTTFRFFENRKAYYFVSNTELLNIAKNNIGYGTDNIDPGLAEAIGLNATTIPIFRINYMPNVTPDRQKQLMYEIQDIRYDTIVNSIEDIALGGYSRKFFELDMLTSNVNEIAYKHPLEKTIHSQEFLDTYDQNPIQRYMIKDYRSEGNLNEIRTDTHYAELHNDKKTSFYHYNKNSLQINIYGRNDIFAGSVIDLDLTEYNNKNTNKKDDLRSGRYIVHSVENMFRESVFTQKLVIARETYE